MAGMKSGSYLLERRGWTAGLLVLLGLGLMGAGARGPSQGMGPAGGKEEPTFRFPAAQSRIEVRLGQVEVFVQDKEGKFAPGLKPEDFEILLDGKPLAVKYVDEMTVEKPKPNLTPPPRTVSGEWVRPYRPAGTTPPITPFNTFVILYDASHSGALTFRTIRNRLYALLHRLAAVQTRFMLIRLDPTGDYRVVHPLTDNLDALIRDLDRLSAGARGSNWLVDRLHLLDRDMEGLYTCTTVESSTARNECIRLTLRRVSRQVLSMAQEERRVSMTLRDSFHTLFDFLAHVPGRKSVLLISEGFDPSGNVYLDYFTSLVRRYVNDYNIPPRIEVEILRDLRVEMETFVTEKGAYGEITEEANSSLLTLYWINPATPGALFGAESDIRPTVSASGATFDDITYAMTGIAEDTGGLAWTAPTGFDELFDRIFGDFSHYYLISFDLGQIPEKIERHKIKVKVRRPGLKVRHRKEYVDVPWSVRVNRQLAAALDFSDLYKGDEVKARAVPVWENPERYRLHVNLAYPIKRLVPLTTTPDRMYDEIYVAWVVRSAKEEVLDQGFERIPVQIPITRLPQLEQADAAVQYAKLIEVKERDATVSVALLEAGGWKTSAYRWKAPDLANPSCPVAASLILGTEVKMTDHPAKQFTWTPKGHIRYKNYLVKVGAYQIHPTSGQFGGFYQVILPAGGAAGSELQVRFRLYARGRGIINEVPPTSIRLHDPSLRVLTNFFLLPYHNLAGGEYELELEASVPEAGCRSVIKTPLKVAVPSRT